MQKLKLAACPRDATKAAHNNELATSSVGPLLTEKGGAFSSIPRFERQPNRIHLITSRHDGSSGMGAGTGPTATEAAYSRQLMTGGTAEDTLVDKACEPSAGYNGKQRYYHMVFHNAWIWGDSAVVNPALASLQHVAPQHTDIPASAPTPCPGTTGAPSPATAVAAGSGILPELWEHVVEPGMMMTMHMGPMNVLNPQPPPPPTLPAAPSVEAFTVPQPPPPETAEKVVMEACI
ncbi:hypothetical protein C8035_v010541 [Colletotrichum spinosum]|uniref:Uncharacterized protein n=1 Tax=Colletotrichum spinosum TaxID=1347390 RepID=A0A4R8PPB8_9PEZI|nr:hypothetical protein C8035_v010541 [Colletotrichum spinosum]